MLFRRPLYEGFKALRDGPTWSSLTPGQQRVVDNELRDFVLGGVALEGEAKERFNEIQQELAKLSTKFSNNVRADVSLLLSAFSHNNVRA